MNKLRFFTSQPDETYFHWQIETYLQNFERIGIDLSQCHVILLYKDNVSQKARELQSKYTAHFHFYPYIEEINVYVPASKPYGMMKYLEEHSEQTSPIFYHDADIIFQTKPDYSNLLEANWMSACMQNTERSYIDLDYLNQFEGLVPKMEEIVQVKAQKQGGGAQYILQPELLTQEYFRKVYEDCYRLKGCLETSETKVQVWCAEMWATLWNVWYFKQDIQIHSDLDFCMSRDTIDKQKNIVHNAGLMGPQNFNKANYRFEYPHQYLQVDQTMCNYIYYKEVQKNTYIRPITLKTNKMNIKITKAGGFDGDTGREYKIGDIVDLGEIRNKNAVDTNYAVWFDYEEATVVVDEPIKSVDEPIEKPPVVKKKRSVKPKTTK